MMDSEPAYETTNVDLKGKDNFANGFGNSYEGIEDDILYIKMDDDIVRRSLSLTSSSLDY